MRILGYRAHYARCDQAEYLVIEKINYQSDREEEEIFINI